MSAKQNLTKVFDSGAVVTEDCDNPGPEHLQGGYVGRKDTERTGKCGHVNLCHTGLLEEHLESGDGEIHSLTYGLSCNSHTSTTGD